MFSSIYISELYSEMNAKVKKLLLEQCFSISSLRKGVDESAKLTGTVRAKNEYKTTGPIAVCGRSVWLR